MYIPGCCTYLDAVLFTYLGAVHTWMLHNLHTWMLYIQAPVSRSQTQSRPSTEADPAVDGERRSAKISFENHIQLPQRKVRIWLPMKSDEMGPV